MTLGGARGRSLIVVFSGTDGSGKTTLAHQLVNELRGMGIRTEYVWCRHESDMVRALVKIARFMGGGRCDVDKTTRGYEAFKKRVFATLATRGIYKTFVMIDYLIEVKSRIMRELGRVDILVVDRYVMDVAADVTVECDLNEKDSVEYLRTLQRLVPRPGVSFLVTVPVAVSLERKDDIPSREYVERRLMAFGAYSKEGNVVPIDGMGPINDATLHILGLVLSARGRSEN